MLKEEAWEAWGEALKKSMPEIIKLHEKECGCGWTPENNNIFEYMPKESEK